MLDNELIALVISTITAQELAAGIPGTPIAQAFQPTQQGPNTVRTAYLHKVGDHRRGTPDRHQEWDEDAEKIVRTTTQVYETTFQISALSTQIPNQTTQMTASDLLNLIAYILQSEDTIIALQNAGVGILNVSDIRNTPFIDDHARNEYQPSFDFTLTHKQVVTTEAPVLQSTEFAIYPV